MAEHGNRIESARARHSPGGWLAGAAFTLLLAALSWTYWTQSWPAATVSPTLHVHARKTVHLDGVYYYAYLRSLVFDRDLDFTNDYELLGNPFDAPVHPTTRKPGNVFTIGPAMLWSPFALVGRALAAVSPRWGPPDGSGERFQTFVFFGSCLYGFACCVLSYLIARDAYRRVDALVAALAALFGTPLYWHMMRQASYSHAVSAFLAALLVLCWIRSYGSIRAPRWFSLGLLSGLCMAVRTAAGAHSLVPAAELVPQLLGSIRRRDGTAAVRSARAGASFIAGCFVGFLPQMLAWKHLYGAYLTVPQGEQFMLWGDSRFGAVLFSTWNGWAAWHPLVSLALVGLLITSLRKDLPSSMRRLAGSALVVIAVEAYLNGATEDWFAGFAFGGRRFTDCTVYVALGAAQLFSLLGGQELRTGVSRALRVAIPIGALVGFSYFSFFLADLHLNRDLSLWIPADLGRAWRSAAVSAMDRVYALTGNWGSIPANWWYAAQGDVSPARYDHADTSPWKIEPETTWPFKEPFVALGGFGEPISFMGRECRWMSGREGRFAFSVRRKHDLRAKLDIAARNPGTRVKLTLKGESLLDTEISTGLQTLEFEIPIRLLNTGSNFVHIEQNTSPPEARPLGDTGVILAHDVTAHSAGWGVGMSSWLSVDGRTIPGGPRGISLFTIDPRAGTSTLVGTYDTFAFDNAVDEFAYAVDDLPSGTIAVLAVADDASNLFSRRGNRAIRELGGLQSLLGAYRSSYAMIGAKGARPGTALESFALHQVATATHGRPLPQAIRATFWCELRLAAEP